MINGGITRNEWIYWSITEKGNNKLIGTLHLAYFKRKFKGRNWLCVAPGSPGEKHYE
jgi:hypothetical protein